MASEKELCQVSNQEVDSREAMPADAIREPILQLIRADHPDFNTDGFISKDELNKYRALYARKMFLDDDHELSKLDEGILQSLQNHNLIAVNPDEMVDTNLTFGQRLADKIATFGGSWRFIITFGVFIVIWITFNCIAIGKAQFDVYPFILLNLILSCLAALQAPVIMMSQNRQESRDRLRSENDYQINVKAEIEIRQIQEKMDVLLRQISEMRRSGLGIKD